MNKPIVAIRLSFFVILLISILYWGCDEDVAKDIAIMPTKGMSSAVIIMEGQKSDTAYLYASYKDPGASVFEDIDGIKNCNELTLVSDITGSVNTKLHGTYFIHYNAKDALGKPLPTATRTVSVVKNKADFLNGGYDVACTCTNISNDLNEPIVNTNYYTSLVTTGSANNSFELVSLHIGSEKIIPYRTFLNDKFIEVNYFGPDYASCKASGTLSATKNTFTIESVVYRYLPKAIYTCKNVFTKKLVLIMDRDRKLNQ